MGAIRTGSLIPTPSYVQQLLATENTHNTPSIQTLNPHEKHGARNLRSPYVRHQLYRHVHQNCRKVANASAEQKVFKLLVDTIDGKREEVTAQCKALYLQLSDEKKQNIGKLVAETGRLVSAVRQLLGKPVYTSKRGVMGGVI